MNRMLAVVLRVVIATILFVGLVYAVLLAGHVAEAGATTVYGLTLRRLWATASALLAIGGVVLGGMALRGTDARDGGASRRRAAAAAAIAGLLGAVSGGLNVALATGGPGTGNGVVGGAAAVVLGLISLTLGCAALARSRQTAGQRRQLT